MKWVIFMVAIEKNSKMEIWCADYINDPVKKLHGDCNIKIVQIEHATGDDYIVEFVREER